MTEKTLFAVTLTRELSIAVYADSRERAEELAWESSDLGDVDWCDAEENASALPMPESKLWDDEFPLGLDDDDDRTVGEIRAGAPPPATERERWAAREPTDATPAALVEWLGTAPPLEGPAARRPWWGTVAGGAAACDGTAIAWAEGAAGPEAHYLGRPWPETYAQTIAKALPGAPERVGRVTLEQFTAWLELDRADDEQSRYGTVLGVQLDRRLVARWALPFVRMAGECHVATRGPLDAVEWTGPGWRVLTMPVRDGAHGGALACEEVRR